MDRIELSDERCAVVSHDYEISGSVGASNAVIVTMHGLSSWPRTRQPGRSLAGSMDVEAGRKKQGSN